MSNHRELEEFKRRLTPLFKAAGNLMFVGIGNEYRTDDGAGVALARRLLEDQELEQKDGGHIIDAGLGLMNHLETIRSEQPDLLIIMDCVEFSFLTEEGRTVPSFGLFSLDQTPLELDMRSLSSHQLPLDFVKGFVKQFSPKTRLFLLGVAHEELDHSEELHLSAAVEELVEALYIIIREALLQEQA